MVKRFRRRISEIDSITIDREPEEMTIAGGRFTKIDFSGVGLYRTVLVAESRCHFVSLNLTTTDPDQRASLTQSLEGLSVVKLSDRAQQVPVCVKATRPWNI